MLKPEEILGALSHHTWKSMAELIEELCAARKIQMTSFRGAFVSGGVVGGLFVLERARMVESRERPLTEEQLATRGGAKQLEWKLTQDGFRHRHELQQTKKKEAPRMLPEIS